MISTSTGSQKNNTLLVIQVTFAESIGYRRRIKSKEKAKVVAPVWRGKFIQFLAALVGLPRTILNNRMNCTRMI